MAKFWESDNCDQLRSHFAFYPVPVAAMLWCDAPIDEVERELLNASDHPSIRGVKTHPYISCFEPRCRVLHDAIERGVLPCTRENGKPLAPNEYAKPERRHVSREALKAWISTEFPAQKPSFLFDEIERGVHAAINADSFRALQADRDALKARLENAAVAYRALRHERDEIEGQRASLAAKMARTVTPPTYPEVQLATRQRRTLLTIIAALCRKASIDPGSRGASTAIESATAEIGAPVGDDAIRTMLREIPDAIESRSR